MFRAIIHHKREPDIQDLLLSADNIAREDLDLTKRKFIRLNYAEKVSLTAQKKTITVYTSNISEEGLYINSDKLIPLGTMVDVKLHPRHGNEVSVPGKVVWVYESEDKNNAGYAIHTPAVNLLGLLKLSYLYEESKRQFIRITHKIKTVITRQNGRRKKIKGITKNISCKGLYLQSSQWLPLNTVVSIQLYPLHRECIELKGAVVWHNRTDGRYNHGMGLYISTEVDHSIPCRNHARESHMIRQYLDYLENLKKGAPSP